MVTDVVVATENASAVRPALDCVYKIGVCVLCLSCVYQCAMRAISIIEDVSVVIDPEKCVGCGKCADVCQMEAIVEDIKK